MAINDAGDATGGWTITVETPIEENSFVTLNVYSKGSSLFAGYLNSGQSADSDLTNIATSGSQVAFNTTCGQSFEYVFDSA